MSRIIKHHDNIYVSMFIASLVDRGITTESKLRDARPDWRRPYALAVYAGRTGDHHAIWTFYSRKYRGRMFCTGDSCDKVNGLTYREVKALARRHFDRLRDSGYTQQLITGRCDFFPRHIRTSIHA